MPRIATKLMIVVLALGFYSPAISFGQFIDEDQDSPGAPGDEVPGTTPPPDTTPPTTTPPTTPPTTPGGSTELRTPRFNVRGGSVAARRPGTWVAAGLGNAVERQSIMIKQRGGATFQPGVDTPSFRNLFLVGFLENLFDGVVGFLNILLANSTNGGIGGDIPLVPTVERNGRVWEADQQTYKVLVFFMDDVEEQSAETASNYIIGNTVADSAVLDDDLVVTVTFTNASFAANSSLTVNLQNIKGLNGRTGTASTGAILANEDDTTAPTATVASLTDNMQAEVTFSEVMDKASAETFSNYLSVSNNKVPTTAVLGTDGRTVTLTFADRIAGNSLRVSVNNLIKDMNDNGAVQKDISVPAASQPAP